MGDQKTDLGLSGAQIIHLDKQVIKIGGCDVIGERVAEQGEWLRDHACAVLPKVLHVHETMYVMEALSPPTYIASDDLEEYAKVVLEALPLIWRQGYRKTLENPAVWLNEHKKYVHTRARTASSLIEKRIIPMWNKMDFGALPMVCTHGDPTFANLMMRDFSQPVLIDPLPYTQKMPPVRAVDLGKMLQSCFGFEHYVFGNVAKPFKSQKMAIAYVRDSCVDENEFIASLMYCIIHIARAIPYLTRSGYENRVDFLLGTVDDIIRF